MCGITMETTSKEYYIHIIQMFQFRTPVNVYMQDYNYVGRYALKPLVVSRGYQAMARFILVYVSLTSDVYLTWLVVLTVAPAWRSVLTTLG